MNPVIWSKNNILQIRKSHIQYTRFLLTGWHLRRKTWQAMSNLGATCQLSEPRKITASRKKSMCFKVRTWHIVLHTQTIWNPSPLQKQNEMAFHGEDVSHPGLRFKFRTCGCILKQNQTATKLLTFLWVNRHSLNIITLIQYRPVWN